MNAWIVVVHFIFISNPVFNAEPMNWKVAHVAIDHMDVRAAPVLMANCSSMIHTMSGVLKRKGEAAVCTGGYEATDASETGIAVIESGLGVPQAFFRPPACTEMQRTVQPGSHAIISHLYCSEL